MLLSEISMGTVLSISFSRRSVAGSVAERAAQHEAAPACFRWIRKLLCRRIAHVAQPYEAVSSQFHSPSEQQNLAKQHLGKLRQLPTPVLSHRYHHIQRRVVVGCPDPKKIENH